MALELNGKTIETDEDGFLLHLEDWTLEVAGQLAEKEEIDMSDQHWEIVNFLRDYYRDFQIAPAIKILTKEIAKKNQIEKKEASDFLYQLFPAGPAKQACKIAGLPKPTGCV
jgi:tRNA 2-thiouridine synthesizing protein E